jgi:6-methylsalicylate decarboxylase
MKSSIPAHITAPPDGGNTAPATAGHPVTARRNVLAGLAAFGAAALIPGCQTAATGTTAKPHRIDIHHHLLPPDYIAEVLKRRKVPTPQWSPSRSLEDMDKNGIATSLVSCIQPGVWFDDVAAGRRLSRIVNEYGAQMARDYPGRFGLFAVLPMPDVEGSLREIEYAMDTLKADGIGIMTSYGNRWLGDAAFAPIWAELNRRKAVVYNHPHVPACCGDIANSTPVAVVEYAADTSRTISSLIFTGTAARFPDIKWIHSHGGGSVPFILDRFTREESVMNPQRREQVMPNGLMHELKKFYYDTAQANNPGALAAIMNLVPETQVMFGSDFPFRAAEFAVGGLGAYKFSRSERAAIDRGNALRIIPGLKTL